MAVFQICQNFFLFIIIMLTKFSSKFSVLCRLCANENVELISLFSKQSTVKGSYNILDIIERFTTIKISSTDSLPQKICHKCIEALNSILAFQNQCLKSDIKLQKLQRSVEDSVYETFKQIPTEKSNQTSIKVEKIDESEAYCEDIVEPNLKFEDEHLESTLNNIVDSFDVNGKLKSNRWRPRKVTCHICGKLYEKYKLQFHLNKHNGLKPYQCSETNCVSKFAAPHELNKHKKLCHIEGPKLFCDVCGKGFKVNLALKMHRSYHFDPEIPCTVCDKLFRNSRALKKHMLVHSQERKFSCDLCKKSFQTRYTLRIHARVHTLEKPYSCYCGVTFAYKCLLKAHSEKHHKESNVLLPP